MKLMINIPDEAYELLKSKSELDNIAESIIANGTPISTEGDLISREDLKEAIRKRLCISSLKYLTEQEKVIVEEIDNAPTVELFCAYLSDGEVREPCVESPCKHEKPQGDLISRSKLKKVINDFYDSHFIGVVPNELITYANAVDTAINIAPTIDLWQMRQEATENALKKAEVLYGRPQGEWIEVYSDLDYEEYQCSICGRVVIIYKNVDKKELLERYPFCNCGADMRKPNCVTCDHFGKCEGCEKRDEE